MKKLATLVLTLLLTLGLALPVSAYTLYDPATLGLTLITNNTTTKSELLSRGCIIKTGVMKEDTSLYGCISTPTWNYSGSFVELGKLQAGEVIEYNYVYGSTISNVLIQNDSGEYSSPFYAYSASDLSTGINSYYVKTSNITTEDELGKILCDSTTDPQAQMYYVLTKKAISNGTVGTGEVSFLMKVGNTLTQRRTIDIPDSVKINGLTYLVTSIQPCACSGLTYTSNTPIRTINIGANVRSIGDYAFYNTKGLKYINFNGCTITSNNYGKGIFRSSKAKVTYNVSNAAELKAAYTKSRKKTSSKPYVNGATYVGTTFGSGKYIVYDSSLKSYAAKAEYVKSMQDNGYIVKTLKKIPGTNVKGYRYIGA